MASTTKPLPTHIGDVRIPPGFNSYLGDFASSLPQRIMEGAACLAFACKGGPYAGVITAADLSKSAQALLPGALDELDDLLIVCEKHHARKKAS